MKKNNISSIGHCLYSALYLTYNKHTKKTLNIKIFHSNKIIMNDWIYLFSVDPMDIYF